MALASPCVSFSQLSLTLVCTMKIFLPILLALGLAGLAIALVAANAKSKPYVSRWVRKRKQKRSIAEVRAKYELSMDKEQTQQTPQGELP